MRGCPAHNGDQHGGSAAWEVDPVKHHGGLISYLASYIAKKDQTRPGDFTGRYWGVFNRQCLPVGELHTMELTPQQWVRVRRLARKKIENDINRKRWSLFFKNVNPRKPAPGPEYGIIAKHPAIFGNRLFWGQLKSAFHGGCRRLRSWHWMPGEEVQVDGSFYWTIPGYSFGVTSTAIVNRFRPPSRYKARNLNRIRLICDVRGFVEAVRRGVSSGCI
ncbi:MAG: hypothetical protein V4662_00495 [Verrucomicrobiota bacterium]